MNVCKLTVYCTKYLVYGSCVCIGGGGGGEGGGCRISTRGREQDNKKKLLS